MNSDHSTPTLTADQSLEKRKEAVLVDGHVEVLIKSRSRVKAHGEVFTPRHMVNQMLDVVSPDLESAPGFVDKTFFEPSAGDGNFLTAILNRKLAAITERYSPAVIPTESLFALASIYGVELLKDNHNAAQAAMLGEFVNFHQRNKIPCTRRTNLFRAAKFLITENIQHGNTLTGRGQDDEELTFSWWKRRLNVPPTVEREVFTLNSLREAHRSREPDLFTFNDVPPTYAPCRIDQVFKEVRADD